MCVVTFTEYDNIMLPSSVTSLVPLSVFRSFFLKLQHTETLELDTDSSHTTTASIMATEEPSNISQEPQEPQETPKIPDYLASPNAVFGDEGVAWRYGRAPDYTKTRKVWAEGKLVLF